MYNTTKYSYKRCIEFTNVSHEESEKSKSSEETRSCLKHWWLATSYVGGFLSQAPPIIMFFGKTLSGLLKLQKIWNSTLTCTYSLWHSRTTRFFFRWTVVGWWSPRLHANYLCSPITSEPLYRIVCGWYYYNIIYQSYHLKVSNIDSDKKSESEGF